MPGQKFKKEYADQLIAIKEDLSETKTKFKGDVAKTLSDFESAKTTKLEELASNISSFIKNYIGELSKGGNIFNTLFAVIMYLICCFATARAGMIFSGHLDINIDRSFVLFNIFENNILQSD